ncbi:hypothetical protein [Streptomonospora wellingtoniae]|uniref:Uncharacterized protein n=1 Tax=Streptomonospora wellingtoniae TaxID=3075544 RepID=A0ABU2KT31_9ACTN|nr:hypothetical protein [Streptomonospora sp. DSM 45055]MDT0302332.1 hypothetical protein [Streptomonospora sp. DSM 45055]
MRKSPFALACGSAAVALGLLVAGAATTADRTPVPQDMSVSAAPPVAARPEPRHTPDPAPTGDGAAVPRAEQVARSAAARLRAGLGEALGPGAPGTAGEGLGVTFRPGPRTGAGRRNAAVAEDPAPHEFGPNLLTG